MKLSHAALAAAGLGFLLLLTACVTAPDELSVSFLPTPAPASITLSADGRSTQITTMAATVGELLAEAGIVLGPADEIDPPPDASLDAAAGSVTLIRVTERLETVVEPIPFSRRVVRSAELSPETSPRLVQTGEPGEREVSIRVVLRDGVEAERWPTTSRVLRPPRDEIVLIGVSASTDAFPIDGVLAAINDGRAVVWRQSTDNPTQLSVMGSLDGRVFQLSPNGRLLLYSATDAAGETGQFSNALWITDTTGDGEPVPLGIDNVLWAAWDPGQSQTPRLAYTTARSVSLPPGWEANNDLWVLEFGPDAAGNLAPGAPVRLIETYPATYGWWGGHYAWSPTGDRLAYAFADEIGTIEVPQPGNPFSGSLSGADQTAFQPLYRFTAYDSRSDWAWVPALAWSPTGNRLLASVHAGADPAVADPFDQVLIETTTGQSTEMRAAAGMWAFAHWSPTTPERVATLLASEPEASQDSSYTLWFANPDGGDWLRVFPAHGENSYFPRIEQYLAWSPDGGELAFIFDNTLHLMDLTSNDVYHAVDDDRMVSHPSWAPYGAGVAEP